MNHTYQPSGKISPIFWPAAAAAGIITAVAALLCVFGIQASYATLLDVMIYLGVTKYTAKFGALLCIKGGRARKPGFARGVGIVLALWYWLLLLVFYIPVKEVLAAEGSAWIWKWDGAWKEALTRIFRGLSTGAGAAGSVGVKGTSWMGFNTWRSIVLMIWEPVASLREFGAVITGKRGNAVFTMPGIVCVVLLAAVFLAAVLQFSYVFGRQGQEPFCEASGKWAKKTVIYLRCDGQETFLSRLLLGDTAVLAELVPLGSDKAESCIKVSVFGAKESDPFYVSVSKMTEAGKRQAPNDAGNSENKRKKQKKKAYEEEPLAEYLEIDRGTALYLLSRSDFR